MRKNIPTAEEFNRKMHECIEYKKLIKLRKDLKWFKEEFYGMNREELLRVINKRINEIIIKK